MTRSNPENNSKRNILIVIDMQNDFVSGSLGTAEAQAIVPRVVSEIGGAYSEVLYTQDTHEKDYLTTEEGKHLPVIHCQNGTEGWAIESGVGVALAERKAKGFTKPTFGSLDLAEELVRMNQEKPLDQLTFIGLCTDICVISNALVAKAHLPNLPIRVIADCCAGVTPESHETALRAMEACQIEIIRE